MKLSAFLAIASVVWAAYVLARPLFSRKKCAGHCASCPFKGGCQ